MRRYNKFEDLVMSIIKMYGKVQLTYKRESVRSTEVLKQSSDKNKLFEDAGSPYCTAIGNQKRTEFVYQSPLNNIDIRIECKSRQKLTLLGEIVNELSFVAKIPEKLYCLVLSDVLINPFLLKQIKTTIREKNLSNRVWVGSTKQFENYLKKNIIL